MALAGALAAQHCTSESVMWPQPVAPSRERYDCRVAAHAAVGRQLPLEPYGDWHTPYKRKDVCNEQQQ